MPKYNGFPYEDDNEIKIETHRQLVQNHREGS